MLIQLRVGAAVIGMIGVKSTRDITCRPSASLRASLTARRSILKHTILLPASHRAVLRPSGAYTAALPGPAETDTPRCTLGVARQQHKHSVGVAHLTARHRHVRA